ncbi:hypothetical protein ACS0VU_13025, partial [Aliiroseovarius sp. KMU-71]|uniref:hypothetical protein n=1 Tax=Aliiroseovarius sp. KMU-71 TaxID=3453123 RepID=UPI003F489B49
EICIFFENPDFFFKNGMLRNLWQEKTHFCAIMFASKMQVFSRTASYPQTRMSEQADSTKMPGRFR